MRLNHQIFEGPEAATPLVLAHGLFGAARNWRGLGKQLARRRRVIAVDLRNHGDSPWSDAMDYPAMAADIAETIARETTGRAHLLGHSMGGKAAMALALSRPETLDRLIVADIAPVAYDHGHGDYVDAMRSVDLAALGARADADAQLAVAVPDAGLRAFLLSSLALEPEGARWRLNLDALAQAMETLLDFPVALPRATHDGPTLFLRGARSDYLSPEGQAAALRLFPSARVEALEGAGHWLHADRPAAFLDAVDRFLAER